MKISTLLSAAALACLPLAPSSAQGAAAGAPVSIPREEATMLRLRDGRILWGAIVDHTEEGVSFLRLDNGGTVTLRWAYLDPSEERDLRMQFGYVETGAAELMVEADLISLIDGSERVGIITERTATELWLKTADGRLPIPLQRLAGPSAVVQVPALDVYTKEELYQQELMGRQSALLEEGAVAAEAHFQVAQFCEQLLDFEKALLHYEAVERLDPTYEAESMPAILKRTAEKAAVQAQVDMLQAIDLWRARGHFDRANKDIALFRNLYPGSPLTDDLNKLADRVMKYQERALRNEVVRSFHHWAGRLAQTAARKMSYEEALAYLDGGMEEDVLKKVHEDLQGIAPEIKADEARELWEQREGGKMRQASYGNGTWLIGKDAALAGVEAEDETQAVKGTQDEARRQIEDKIKRYLKNQEVARKAQAGGKSEEDDPNAFWSTWPSPNRTQWVLAYFVENSGAFRLDRARFRSCRECGGTGTRSIVFTGGAVQGSQSGERLVPCPTCKHIGVVRMVKYR